MLLSPVVGATVGMTAVTAPCFFGVLSFSLVTEAACHRGDKPLTLKGRATLEIGDILCLVHSMETRWEKELRGAGRDVVLMTVGVINGFVSPCVGPVQ